MTDVVARERGHSAMKRPFSRRRLLTATSGLALAGPALMPRQRAAAAPARRPRAQGDLAGTEIRMAMVAGYKADGLAASPIPVFEEQTGITVSLDNLPYNNLVDKLTVSLSSGAGDYDVAFIDEPWVVSLSPFLLPLDDLIARDGFNTEEIIPNALASGEHDGALYAMAVDPNVPLLWYRTDILEEQQVAELPTTWDEVLTLAPSIASPYAYALSARKDVQTAVNAEMFLWSLGGEILTADNQFGFDSPEGRAAMELFQQMLEISPPGVLGYAFTETNQAFMAGQVTMIHQWASAGVTLTDAEQSSVADRVGWGQMPGVPMRGVWTMGIPNDSDKADAAWEFVKFMAGPEGGKLYIEGGSGHSARYDVMRDPDTQQRFPWAEQLLSAIEEAKARPRIAQWAALDNIVQTMATEVLAGESTADEAITSAAEQVTDLLAR